MYLSFPTGKCDSLPNRLYTIKQVNEYVKYHINRWKGLFIFYGKYYFSYIYPLNHFLQFLIRYALKKAAIKLAFYMTLFT
jgi:uncharacterized membrane protein YbhN (UPF0104 family)